MSGAPPELVLRLYVAGDSPNSVRSMANLKEICGQRQVRVEVVDVFQEPLRPLLDGVLVTPTLVRVSPGPPRKILGDLSDTRAVVAALGLDGIGS